MKTKQTVISLRNHPEYLEQGIAYFQKQWSTEDSKMVYEDSITRSLTAKSKLPLWYLLVEQDEIIGCCGLINNDFISCSDLYPWLCALYIEENRRGNNFASLLIDRAKEDSRSAGFSSLYLCTDHKGYYEKFGFSYLCDGYHPWGETSRVYECVL